MTEPTPAAPPHAGAAAPACAAPVWPPKRPDLPSPPGATCCHAHVFGPADRFPYGPERSYTPPDAPLEKYLAMLDALGLARGVLVQGSAHGLDNAAMLDALAREPARLRGVAVARAAIPDRTLREWHRLGVRALRFNHLLRDGKPYYGGTVGLDELPRLAGRMADLGWHLQLWTDTRDLPDLLPRLRHLAIPVVVDHMGRLPARAGTAHPGFQALLRWLAEGGCWVKVSGAYRLDPAAPGHAGARPFHEALVAANPEQLVWGTDWPHPRVEGTMPDTGALLDLFNAWTPDAATRKRILADNPARLYGF